MTHIPSVRNVSTRDAKNKRRAVALELENTEGSDYFCKQKKYLLLQHGEALLDLGAGQVLHLLLET